MTDTNALGTNDLVMVVDDEPMVLRVLDRILRGVGHTVILAHGAAQIDRYLANASLGVVLLDLFMEGVQGVDVLDRIKRERPDIEVVVVTGHGSIDSAVHCMRRGAFDYLEKPFRDLGRIRSTVRTALAHRAGRLAAHARPVLRAAESTGPEPVTPSIETSVPLSLEAYERLALERALAECGGDARHAAARLGIGRSTFYRKAAKLGIDLRRVDESGAFVAGVGRGPSIG